MSRVTAVTISRLLDTVAIRIGDRLVVIPQEVCNGPISPPDEINIAIELSQVCRVAFSPMDGQRPVAMVTADVDILENAGRACLSLWPQLPWVLLPSLLLSILVRRGCMSSSNLRGRRVSSEKSRPRWFAILSRGTAAFITGHPRSSTIPANFNDPPSLSPSS